jgi:hypothetical protein
MKQLNKTELYEHLSGFLKAKGIEFKEGSYAQAIQKSCSFLTDVVNLGQQGLGKAKTKIDKNLDRVRQAVHEATAPKTNGRSSATPPPPPNSAAKPAAKTASRQAKGKARKPRR